MLGYIVTLPYCVEDHTEYHPLVNLHGVIVYPTAAAAEAAGKRLRLYPTDVARVLRLVKCEAYHLTQKREEEKPTP